MKKLLLALSIISFISIKAQPVAGNARFITTTGPIYEGEFRGLVAGGTPPYNYHIEDVEDHMDVSITPNGGFRATVMPNFVGDAQFIYNASDANGLTSNPGTIHIECGQEKG